MGLPALTHNHSSISSSKVLDLAPMRVSRCKRCQCNREATQGTLGLGSRISKFDHQTTVITAVRVLLHNIFKMMICFGGVCVPLNLLLPFLVGLMHRYGFFQWLKPEYVTLRYWKKRYAERSSLDSVSFMPPYPRQWLLELADDICPTCRWFSGETQKADTATVEPTVQAEVGSEEKATGKQGETVRQRHTQGSVEGDTGQLDGAANS